MRKFDFYEFAGIFAPGSLLLLGLTIQFAEFKNFLFSGGVATTVVFLVLGYIAGQILQPIGNIWETIWWRIRGGMPTDWLINKNEYPIRWKQVILEYYQVNEATIAQEWHYIVREIYADVKSSNRSERIDIFNGNYGMFRGYCATCSILFLIPALSHFYNPVYFVTNSVIFVLSLYRMDRFANHYAKELFAQFVSIKRTGTINNISLN